MKSEQKREPLPDILKGFAVFLVILGHCIQEGSGGAFSEGSLYFYDRLYQFIYSFHMPLFMLISGYFAWDSMEKTSSAAERFRLLKRRSISLLLPVLAWTVFDYVRMFPEHGLAAPAFQSPFALIKAFAISLVTNGWFLWAVFWCFLIVFIVHFYLRDSVLVYAAGFLIMFVIPDGLGLGAYKFMLPYFIAAFYFRAHRDFLRSRIALLPGKLSDTDSPLWIVIIGAAFGLLFLFFDENSMIYLSGYKLIGKDVIRQLKIDIYRTLTGFAGAGFFILLWKKITARAGTFRFPVLSALGRRSLGLYMISGEICLIAGMEMRPYVSPNYMLNLAEAAAVTAVSFILSVILGKIPLLRWLTGGKKT